MTDRLTPTDDPSVFDGVPFDLLHDVAFIARTGPGLRLAGVTTSTAAHRYGTHWRNEDGTRRLYVYAGHDGSGSVELTDATAVIGTLTWGPGRVSLAEPALRVLIELADPQPF